MPPYLKIKLRGLRVQDVRAGKMIVYTLYVPQLASLGIKETWNMFTSIGRFKLMLKLSRFVVLLGAVLVLTILAIIECAGPGKGEGGASRRGGSRSAANEITGAAAEPQGDELLAAALQAEEDQKVAQNNNSGGYSDAAIARDIQIKEEEKAASGRKGKVQPCLKAKPRPDTNNVTVSPPGPSKPELAGTLPNAVRGFRLNVAVFTGGRHGVS
jgi:hypothetical protein